VCCVLDCPGFKLVTCLTEQQPIYLSEDQELFGNQGATTTTTVSADDDGGGGSGPCKRKCGRRSKTVDISQVKFPLPGREYSRKTFRPFIVPCNHDPCCDALAPQKYRLIEAVANGQLSESTYVYLTQLEEAAKAAKKQLIAEQQGEQDEQQKEDGQRESSESSSRPTTTVYYGCHGFLLKDDGVDDGKLPEAGRHYDEATLEPFVEACTHDDCDVYSREKYLMIKAFAKKKIDPEMWDYLNPIFFEPWKNMSLLEWQEQFEMDLTTNVHTDTISCSLAQNEADIIKAEIDKNKNALKIWYNYVPGYTSQLVYMTRKDMHLSMDMKLVPESVLRLVRLWLHAGCSKDTVRKIEKEISKMINGSTTSL
jgi:hypothetical protein